MVHPSDEFQISRALTNLWSQPSVIVLKRPLAMAYINTCKVDNPHLATFLLGYLYLSDMWFGVARRMHTKKHIFKEI